MPTIVFVVIRDEVGYGSAQPLTPGGFAVYVVLWLEGRRGR